MLRFLTAIWALWFGVALVDPSALETCPMHGVHAGHSASMPGHAASHSGGSKHSSPSGHSCTCLGACCSAPTVAMPAAEVAELSTEVIAVDASPAIIAEELAPASAPPHAHPFANGPPALSVRA